MITTSASATKAALDGINPNQLADAMRAVQIGHVMRALPIRIFGLAAAVAAANPYVAAAAQSYTLPDDAKAALISRAYARAGTGTLGPLTIDTADPTGAAAAPSAGHIAISPNGDLVFNAADAWTAVDVLYTPEKYDMVELTLPVVSNVLTLPTVVNGQALNGTLLAAEIQSTAGTAIKSMIVDAPGTAVAAAHAALALSKLTINFNSADAVTQARVKFAVASFVDLNLLLEAPSLFF